LFIKNNNKTKLQREFIEYNRLCIEWKNALCGRLPGVMVYRGFAVHLKPGTVSVKTKCGLRQVAGFGEEVKV
jgi:hypothetical protein